MVLALAVNIAVTMPRSLTLHKLLRMFANKCKTDVRRWGKMLSLFCWASVNTRFLIQASWCRSSTESRQLPISRDTLTYRAVILFNSWTPFSTARQERHRLTLISLRVSLVVQLLLCVSLVKDALFDRLAQSELYSALAITSTTAHLDLDFKCPWTRTYFVPTQKLKHFRTGVGL